jgi:hypothetical protein
MPLLTEADYDVLVAHGDPYSEYPHWRSAWREIQNRHKESEDRYWLMPPELDAVIRQAIGECALYPSRRKAGPRLNRISSQFYRARSEG